jgi:hypothetical protein
VLAAAAQETVTEQQVHPVRDFQEEQLEVIVLTVIQPVVAVEPVVLEAIGAKLELVNLLLDLGDKTVKAATVAQV